MTQSGLYFLGVMLLHCPYTLLENLHSLLEQTRLWGKYTYVFMLTWISKILVRLLNCECFNSFLCFDCYEISLGLFCFHWRAKKKKVILMTKCNCSHCRTWNLIEGRSAFIKNIKQSKLEYNVLLFDSAFSLFFLF